MQKQRNMTFSLPAVSVAAGLFFSLAGSAQALEIDEVIWGFDGKVVAGHFNPVSILVSNRSSTTFEGTLSLRQSSGGAGWYGAKLIEPVYLTPNSSYWVRFYPFIKNGYESWKLRMGPGASFDVPTPTLGKPGAVLLTDPDALTAHSGFVKRFPDNVFPPTVGATDGLSAVLLDHVPRWEEARRRAFLDWLHRGGTIHLLQGENGKFPLFPAGLADLNLQLPSYRVGAGMVLRHPRTSHSLDQGFIEKVVLADRITKNTTMTEEAELDEALQKSQDDNGELVEADDWNQIYGNEVFQDFSGSLFNQLKQMTKAKHSWSVIYLMSLAYILMIFPGFYLLGRRRKDYRMIYVSMLLLVVVFSFGFSYIGRRGYDEATTMNSVMIAREVSAGDFDVSGWSAAFVTEGSDYSITQEGTGCLYSTCQEVEAVNGIITKGAQAQFAVDIPPYSYRTFATRARIESDFPSPVVTKFSAGEKLEKLSVTFADGFSESQQRLKAYALYKDRLYHAWLHRGVLTTHSSTSLELREILEKTDEYNFQYYGPFGSWGAEKPVAQRYLELQWPLILRSFARHNRDELLEFALPDDRVRLFVSAPLPEQFRSHLALMREPQRDIANQAGYVMYIFDLFPAERL